MQRKERNETIEDIKNFCEMVSTVPKEKVAPLLEGDNCRGPVVVPYLVDKKPACGIFTIGDRGYNYNRVCL